MTAMARPGRGGLPNHVLGLYLVIAAELMFFAGLVSALVVARANLTVWIPADQPRLPIPRTAFNTALLLLSGLTMRAARLAARRALTDSRGWLAATAALGAMFVALQGVEWAHLLGYGITAQSSLASGFFYLIVGAHAAHVLPVLPDQRDRYFASFEVHQHLGGGALRLVLETAAAREARRLGGNSLHRRRGVGIDDEAGHAERGSAHQRLHQRIGPARLQGDPGGRSFIEQAIGGRR